MLRIFPLSLYALLRRRLNRRYFKLVGQLCVGELLYALHLPGKGAEEILGW